MFVIRTKLSRFQTDSFVIQTLLYLHLHKIVCKLERHLSVGLKGLLRRYAMVWVRCGLRAYPNLAQPGPACCLGTASIPSAPEGLNNCRPGGLEPNLILTFPNLSVSS